MKVLQVLPELNAGGVEGVTCEIAAHLTAAGHQSLVASHGGRMVPVLEAAGSRHFTLPIHRKHPATLAQILPFRRLLVAEKPEILHLHSRLPAWIAWLAWNSLPAATRPRLVTTVHGFYSVNPYSAVMTRGERVIAVSQSVSEYILRNFPATQTALLRVIYNGIEQKRLTHDFQPSPEWRARWEAEHPQFAGRHILLLPGRITRLKGHIDFFRLVAALLADGIKIHGVVVGDTHPKKRAYLSELHTHILDLGLESHITFLGHRDDISEIMSASDIVFSVSQRPESFGRTVLEALALGTPAIGWDRGGVGEILRQLFPAGLVPAGNHEALDTATRRVLAQKPAPAPVGEPFTLEAMCRSTLDLYQELLSTPAHG